MAEDRAYGDLVMSKAAWLLWGLPMALGLVAVVWPQGRAALLSIAFSWAGIACLVNAKRCGRFHCHITGPLYLGLALVSALNGFEILGIAWLWIGIVFALGTTIAYLPEFLGWRYVRRDSGQGTVE